MRSNPRTAQESTHQGTHAGIPEFLFPGRLIVREGAARELPSILQSVPAPGPVFLVVDPAIRSLGMIDPIVKDLQSDGRSVTVFDRIVGEPQAADVQAGIDLARASTCAVFIGIGGGSALDAAKMIALGSRLNRPLREIVGKQEEIAHFPPLLLLPTTTGTGSEATRVAMYGYNGAKRAIVSSQFVPKVAVLDTDLVAGLPAPIIAATALDALAHALESLMSTTSNPLTELFAVEAARLILQNLDSALQPDGYEARGALLYASFLAGVSLNAGVVLGHSLSYVIAGHYGLSHGVGCAIALPYCIAYNGAMDSERGAHIARAVLQDPDADLERLSQVARGLAQDAQLPISLDELKNPAAPANELAAQLVAKYPRPTNPVPLDEDRLANLIACMSSGDLDAAWKEMAR